MNLRFLQVGAILAVMGILISCERTDAVDPEVVSLYVDLRIASEEYGNTSEARIARQNLMRQAGYSIEKFTQKVQEIRSNPELWMKFQNDVVSKLDSLRNPSAVSPVKALNSPKLDEKSKP